MPVLLRIRRRKYVALVMREGYLCLIFYFTFLTMAQVHPHKGYTAYLRQIREIADNIGKASITFCKEEIIFTKKP
jgi:hypothetical protein